MPTKSLARQPDLLADSGLPHVEPITLSTRADAFDDPDWLFEPKYDGFRGLVYASRHGCEIRSSRDLRFGRFDELTGRISEILGGHDAILDGEIVALDRKGKPVFGDLLRGQGFLAFAAFDLAWLDGCDLRPLPLMERKRRLAELLPADTGPLYKILTLEEHGRALFSAIRKMELAGIVAKRMSDPYHPTTRWYKIANTAYTLGEIRGDVFRRRERARRADREV
jgi:bifunctional non-homologous end joining protein LigD